MKALKKGFALLLALTMIFGLAATAFAADQNTGNEDNTADKDNGQIKITNPLPETEYFAYRLLAVESWEDTTEGEPAAPETVRDGNYSYKLAGNSWDTFFKNNDYAKKFFTIDNDGYVSFEETYAHEGGTLETFNAVTFTDEALAYAKANKLNTATACDAYIKTGTIPADDADKTLDPVYLKKSDSDKLPLGYYLVDTSVGALCSLGTTDKVAEIKEKQGKPDVEKKIIETGKDPAEENDVNIGDTVNYEIIITAQAGAADYILHDTMDSGLTFDKTYDDDAKKTKGIDSVTIKYAPSKETADLVLTEATTVAETENSYSLEFNVDHDQKSDTNPLHTFDMHFNADALKTLSAGDKIIVKYHAVLNEGAEIDIGDNKNQNDTYLEYGDHHTTEHQYTETYTFDFNVYKHDAKDNAIAVDGAKFKLSTDAAGEKVINLVAYTPENPTVAGAFYYKVCNLPTAAHPATGAHTHVADETEGNGVFTTNTTGKFFIEGLDSGDYYLTEVDAPDGYNTLKHPVKINIDTDGKVYLYTATYNEDDKMWEFGELDKAKGALTDDTVKIANTTGKELPATGGMGTTLFYVIGGILMVGAAVLLITKKRMSV